MVVDKFEIMRHFGFEVTESSGLWENRRIYRPRLSDKSWADKFGDYYPEFSLDGQYSAVLFEELIVDALFRDAKIRCDQAVSLEVTLRIDDQDVPVVLYNDTPADKLECAEFILAVASAGTVMSYMWMNDINYVSFFDVFKRVGHDYWAESVQNISGSISADLRNKQFFKEDY